MITRHITLFFLICLLASCSTFTRHPPQVSDSQTILPAGGKRVIQIKARQYNHYKYGVVDSQMLGEDLKQAFQDAGYSCSLVVLPQGPDTGAIAEGDLLLSATVLNTKPDFNQDAGFVSIIIAASSLGLVPSWMFGEYDDVFTLHDGKQQIAEYRYHIDETAHIWLPLVAFDKEKIAQHQAEIMAAIAKDIRALVNRSEPKC